MSKADSRWPKTDPPRGFISRWSELKLASQQQAGSPAQKAEPSIPVESESEPLCDADMPPIESLTEESDYRGFFSERVSEALRREALRKLFHSPAFNVCDGLDDYTEDFTGFAKLGEIITSDMRHQIALAEERLTASLESVSNTDSPLLDQREQSDPSIGSTPDLSISADKPGSDDGMES